MRKLVFVAAMTLGALAAQEAVIRGGVSLVDLLVTVRDKKGGLLKDLKQADFKVLEDGKQVELRGFARETDVPLTIGMLVDISGSVDTKIPEERLAARKFFDQVLRPQDQAFLISFGRSATLLQDTTSSKQKLQEGLDELGPDRLVAAPPAVVNAQFPRGRGQRFPMPGPQPGLGRSPGRGRGGGVIQMGGTVLWDAVFLAADEVLKPTSGRKAIILITDGVDQGSRITLTRALEAAQRSDVIVYSIQVRAVMGRIMPPLEQLSTETGGRVFRLDGKLDKIFAEISDELRSQYALSYAPPDDARDGMYHQIEIQMANRNHKAQARKGYYGCGAGSRPASPSC